MKRDDATMHPATIFTFFHFLLVSSLSTYVRKLHHRGIGRAYGITTIEA